MLLSRAVTKAFYTAYNDDLPTKERLDGTFELLRFGYVDNAREVIEKLKIAEPGLTRVEWLDQACDRAGIYHKDSFETINGAQSAMVYGLADPIKIHPPTDVMIIRAPQAEQVLIAFGGAAEAFWAPPPFFELSNCHVVVLRDARRLFHFAGVEGLGATYEECLEGLKKIIADLGASKVFVTGSSSGGYAALRYGLDLEGVRGVLAISPFTGSADVPREVARFPALRPIMRMQPEMLVDLLPLYEQHPNPPKVIIVWGDKNVVDNEQATRMKVLPNVILEPLHGFAGHPVWVKLLADQHFEPLLRRLFAA